MVSLLPITTKKKGPKPSTVFAQKKPAADPWSSVIQGYRAAIMSPADILKTARGLIGAEQASALKLQRAETQAEQARINQQAQRAQGFAQALARLNVQTPEQAQQGYLRAAQAIQGLGTGLTGAVAQSQQQAADETAAAVARMTGGVGPTATTGLDVGALKNAALYGGVTLPARSLAEQSAAARDLARIEAARSSYGIGAIARDYLAKSQEVGRQGLVERQKLLATRPSLVAQMAQELRGNRATQLQNLASLVAQRQTQQASTAQQAASLAVQKQYLANTLAKTQADVTGLIPGTNIPTAETRAETVSQEQSASRLAAQWSNYNKYRSDAAGNPILKNGRLQPIAGYKVGPSGQNVVKIPTAKAGARGGGGLTADQWTDLVADAQDAAQEWATGKPAEVRTIDGELRPVPGTRVPKLGYAEIRKRLLARGPKTARWRRQAEEIAQGVYAEGEGGRPFTGRSATQAAASSAQQAFLEGIPYEQALKAARQQSLVPFSVAKKALYNIYWRGPFSPIPGTEDIPGHFGSGAAG